MSEIRPTDAQLEAIETTGRAVMVEAGAGTGKTWVLVRRFMYLLEQNRDWPLESIVAITFTEKAAREMRTRLRSAIEEQAAAQPEDAVWQGRRRALDRLQVSTIHSLCARILRENALAVPVDPLFEVLDEQDAEVMKEEAIRRVLRELVETDHPALGLLVSLRVYDLRAEMEGMLAKRGVLTRLFDALEPPDVLLEKWETGLDAMLRGMWEAYEREHPELPGVVDEMRGVEILDPGDRLAGAVTDAQEGSRAYRRDDLRKALECWGRISRVGGRADAWGGKDAKTYLSQELLKPLQDAGKALQGALADIGTADSLAAEDLQHWRDLWEILDRRYDELKRERQALDFDDLEMLTEDFLNRMPRPARLRTYLEGVHHVMVDEYQDTNLNQQQIVSALAPLEEPGRLFVVGDAKQSIYRFRQAQVSIFNDTSKKIVRATGHTPVPLNTSFRTHAELVAAQNYLFDRMLQPQGAVHAPFEAAPGPLHARRSGHPDLTHPVEIVLLPDQDKEGGRINAEDGRVMEARWLAHRLLALRKRGLPVWDKKKGGYRAFEYRDAAVLFRATTSLPLYETEFKAAGLPYLTISGRGYYDRPEVQDLLALLHALANPGDDLSVAVVLRSPMIAMSDETIYRLRWHGPGGERLEAPRPFRAALDHPPPTEQPDTVHFAARVFRDLQGLTGRTDVWTLLRRALDLTGYEAVLARNDRESGRQRSNVEKLLAIARDRGDASLPDFLVRLKDLRAREAREGEAQGREPESGAVQLMSIHASKGLEFPVVVVADLGRMARSGFGKPYLLHDPEYGLACRVRDENGDWQDPAGYLWAAWQHDRMEEAERRRLLYVAATRAADLLILSGQSASRSSWMQDILAAYALDADGPPEETAAFDDFALRIYRPEQIAGFSEKLPAEEFDAGRVFLEAVPPLAGPLPGLSALRVTAVTALETVLKPGQSPDTLPRPALWRQVSDGSDAGTARAASVGNVVHRALAQWKAVAEGGAALTGILELYTRQEGVPWQAQQNAVRRAYGMLTRFRQHPLFKRIAAAPRRFAEMPVTLEYPGGALHGIMDLIYLDNESGWQLLDWKTGWQGDAEAEEAESEEAHRRQLAVYAAGFERLVGEPAQAALCYLNPQVQMVRVDRSEVVRVTEEILSGVRDPGAHQG